MSTSNDRRLGSGIERPRVLVVDDDPASREAARELLGARYEVLCGEDGAQALELVRAHAPDMVLMDVAMPAQDGMATLRELRAEVRLDGVPVIFMSGSSDEQTQIRCLELGADFLAKPLPAGVLVARIERALRESRERRALAELAQTDALTGLANFRALDLRLNEEFKRATRYHYPLSAVMIDLDHLKVINDRFGHEVGNRVIHALARHLRSNLREVDFAARFGGDEFVVLLPHQTAAEAAIFGERLRSGLGSISVRGTDGVLIHLNLTVSVGIAAQEPGAPKHSAEHLMHSADAAVYEAKRRGRNQIRIFERDLLHPTVAAVRH